MIFMSKNEQGTPAWQLVFDEKKTVTRRLKPQPIGVVRAVQPGRGKKGVGFIRIKSCVPHLQWVSEQQTMSKENIGTEMRYRFQVEAEREGFVTWEGLLKWFTDHKIDINKTYRIEFELIEKEIP